MLLWEWLKEWVDEIFDMGRIGWEKLFMKLAAIEAIDEQTQGACQRFRTTGKTTRRSSQASQVMPQFGVVRFHREGVGLAFRDGVPTIVIPQAIISIKGVRVILLGFGRIIHQALDLFLRAFPHHFPAQITAGLPIYEREDVDPVFLLPMKVNNSSISATWTSVGTGASGKLAALALTHNDTVRW